MFVSDLTRPAGQPAGVFALWEKKSGRYLAAERVPDGVITSGPMAGRPLAQDYYQLPKKIENNQWVEDITAGRFECTIQTSDIAEDCSIPRGYTHSSGPVQYVGQNRLEPAAIENPSRGTGGHIQFVQDYVYGKRVRVTIRDKVTGETE